ncbi:MAG: DUF6443 domain-containing protein, partial [Bacteroidota bacterium]
MKELPLPFSKILKSVGRMNRRNQQKQVIVKVVVLVVLLVSVLFSHAQNTEYIGETTLTGNITSNYVYTKSVTIKPEAVINSANGNISIRPFATNPPPSPNENYVRTEVARVPVNSEVALTNMTAEEKVTSFDYSDGLGRAKMNVIAKGGSRYEDIVQHYQYNESTGRQDKSYLPYAKVDGNPGSIKTNPTSDLDNFYNGTNGIPNDSKYYTETEWDAR